MFVAPATDGGIRTARAAAVAAGGGIVLLPDAQITLTSSLPIDTGVHYLGVPPRQTFTTNVPDGNWTITGGTRLVGDGTFPAFWDGTTDQASPTPASPNFAVGAISNFGIENVSLDTFSYGVKAGATNVPGLQFSTLKNIFIRNCTSWGMELHNFMHCDIRRIFGLNNTNFLHFLASMAAATLSPGNTRMDTLFGLPPNNNLNARGIVFEASVSGAQLNEIFAERVQFNAFNRTQVTQTATFTNASANIAVTDSSKFPVGMPVSFSSTAAGFKASQIYVVLTSAANVITLGNSRSTTAVSATAGTTATIGTFGMPCLEVIGASGAMVMNSIFQGLDLEGTASCHLYAENTSAVQFEVAQVPNAGAYAHICLRNAQFSYVRSLFSSASTDFDGNSSGSIFEGMRGTIIQRTGIGIWTDGVRSVNALALFGGLVGNTADLHARAPNGLFLYPESPMGQRVTALNTSQALTAGQAGVLVFSGSSATTYTLPTIVDNTSTPISSYVGIAFEIVNAGTATLTVNTDGTQLFNSVAAKTSYALTAGQSLRIVAAKNTGGTLLWAAFPTNGVS